MIVFFALFRFFFLRFSSIFFSALLVTLFVLFRYFSFIFAVFCLSFIFVFFPSLSSLQENLVFSAHFQGCRLSLSLQPQGKLQKLQKGKFAPTPSRNFPNAGSRCMAQERDPTQKITQIIQSFSSLNASSTMRKPITLSWMRRGGQAQFWGRGTLGT